MGYISVITTVFAILNLALLIGLGYLITKFLVSGIKYFSSKSAKKDEKELVRQSLAEVLKNHRLQNGMTQEFVAQRLGVSRQAVSKWENGTSEPSTSNLLAIAKLYGISAGELLNQAETQL